MIENEFNQLTSLTSPAGITRFSYDGRGNQIRKDEPSGSTTYQYDPRNVLTDITLPSGQVNHYGYDPAGLRVLMQDGQGNRRILLDGIEEYAEHESVNGIRVARYDHDPSRVDALLAQMSDQGKYHFQSDALGSVSGLGNSIGALASTFSYDAFGARTVSAADANTVWAFSGRRLDPSLLGQLFYRARYYSAQEGRFLSTDPIATALLESPAIFGYSRIHPYAPFLNAPTTFIDPDGRFAIPAVVFGIVAAALGLYLLLDDIISLVKWGITTSRGYDAATRLRRARLAALDLLDNPNQSPAEIEKVENELIDAQKEFLEALKKQGAASVDVAGTSCDTLGDMPLEGTADLLRAIAALKRH